jgi:hypothetical protein
MASGGNMNMDSSFTIPKLTMKNYNAWMVRIRSEILLGECWEEIIGYEDGERTTQTLAETKRRTKNNLTTLSLILRSVSD